MTRYIKGNELKQALDEVISNAVEESNDSCIWVKLNLFHNVAKILRYNKHILFDLLVSITAVDYIDHFDMVYHFRSLQYNTFGVVKVKTGFSRLEPVVPSVMDIWRGADLQEREVWDLMGVRFEGRENIKRIMLWEGFPGHPLRKDFVNYEQSVVRYDK